MFKTIVLCVALGAAGASVAAGAAAAAPLATAEVQRAGAAQGRAFDGVVEAVRQTVVAAQVPGAVTALAVKGMERGATNFGSATARSPAR